MNYSSIRFICLCVIALFTFPACTWHKTEVIAPKPVSVSTENPCDTSHISYTNCIVPILRNNCYACHSTALTDSTGGLDLENYNKLKLYLNYYFQNDSIYGSKFMHIVEQTSGVIPMPPTGKIPNDDIARLKSWIQHGAPQN